MNKAVKKIKQIVNDLQGWSVASDNTKNITPLNLKARQLIAETLDALNDFQHLDGNENGEPEPGLVSNGIGQMHMVTSFLYIVFIIYTPCLN